MGCEVGYSVAAPVDPVVVVDAVAGGVTAAVSAAAEVFRAAVDEVIWLVAVANAAVAASIPDWSPVDVAAASS